MFKLKVLSQVIAAAAATSFLVGCGGGSSSGSSTSDNTDVTGSVFASYVAGASVEVQDTAGNPIAGPVKTAANGRFTLSVPKANLGGNLVFVATGGAYVDEATGSAGVNSERLAVFAAANSLTGNPVINTTPGSSLIERLIVQHGLTEAKAKEYFNAAFGYLPDSAVTPADATQDNSGASDEAKLAGVRAAAFSQLLKNLGLEAGDHKALIDALAEDLVDGEVDGMNGVTPVQLKGGAVRHDMASQFAMALMDFANDADRNKSGLNPGQVGLIQFIPKAESDNYSFELTPQGMVKEGKVTFDLSVKNPDTALSGVTSMMMPMMYMAGGHKHSTPNAGCTVTDAEGVAECTVYFLMPSAMGNGDVMGNWDLKFSVGMGDAAESVHFYPKVMMAMGDDTSKLMLMGDKAHSDAVTDMDGKPAGRSYFIYKDSIMGSTGDHTVKFFVATKDSMMSFPSLEAAGVDFEVNGVAAISEGNGVWRADNVAGLIDGELGAVSVKLTVDGQDKMLDEGNNDADKAVTAFNITPGSM